jgi:putative phosphotransacetylase
MKIPIEVSARHIHLCQKDMETLFGRGYRLKKIKQLSQPHEFAAEEKVQVKIGDSGFNNLRIVGPVRKDSQIEISATDAISLGVKAPLRLSGRSKRSPSAILIGPKGKITLDDGVIIARRHLHCSLDEAEKLGVRNGKFISIKIEGKRSLVFNNIIVRAGKKYKLCFQIDTDEGNAAGIIKKGEGYLVNK